MTFDTKAIRREVEYNTMRQSDAIPSLLIACKVIDDLRDEIDRLRAPKPQPQPQGKMVRVKVAVGVEPTGKWNAFGWSHGTDAEKMELAVEPLNPGESRYWLTADLPVPEEVTVKAEVGRE